MYLRICCSRKVLKENVDTLIKPLTYYPGFCFQNYMEFFTQGNSKGDEKIYRWSLSKKTCQGKEGGRSICQTKKT